LEEGAAGEEVGESFGGVGKGVVEGGEGEVLGGEPAGFGEKEGGDGDFGDGGVGAGGLGVVGEEEEAGAAEGGDGVGDGLLENGRGGNGEAEGAGPAGEGAGVPEGVATEGVEGGNGEGAGVERLDLEVHVGGKGGMGVVGAEAGLVEAALDEGAGEVAEAAAQVGEVNGVRADEERAVVDEDAVTPGAARDGGDGDFLVGARGKADDQEVGEEVVGRGVALGEEGEAGGAGVGDDGVVRGIGEELGSFGKPPPDRVGGFGADGYEEEEREIVLENGRGGRHGSVSRGEEVVADLATDSLVEGLIGRG